MQVVLTTAIQKESARWASIQFKSSITAVLRQESVQVFAVQLVASVSARSLGLYTRFQLQAQSFLAVDESSLNSQ